MRHPLLISLLIGIGCGGKTVADTTTVDAAGDGFLVTDTGTPVEDCTPGPEDPPIACGPVGEPPGCFDTSKVASCPTANPCMAVATPSGAVLHQRVGRLRVWSPPALLSLTSIAIDPEVSPHCFNGGMETMNLRLDIDRAAKTLTVGASRPSADGTKYPLTTESIDGASLTSGCPGFVGPSAPISFAPKTTTYTEIVPGAGLHAKLAAWNLPIFDMTPWALPLRDVVVHAPAIGQCIGKWDARFWCDGDSLGWTTGGSIVGHITLEDADRIPIKPAGCQSLCAILVNDATKTDKGLCKRGPDGKVPEWGDSCVGAAGCRNAFTLSTTFASYEVLP